MRSYPEFTPSSQNAFSPSFLRRLGERDEPPAAGEADVAGPWHVLEDLEDGTDGAVLGHFTLFDESLADALNVAASLVRLPASLAFLLEGAGQVSLERAGAILEEKVS